MKGFGDLYKDKKKKNKPPTEQIINQAIQLHLQGNITEASKYYKQLINQGCNNPSVFSNYGAILYGLGKLQDAENLFRKAIELNPNLADAFKFRKILRSRQIRSRKYTAKQLNLILSSLMHIQIWEIYYKILENYMKQNYQHAKQLN